MAMKGFNSHVLSVIMAPIHCNLRSFSDVFRMDSHPECRGSRCNPKVEVERPVAALRSRGGAGRFERGLVSRRAREAEKRDGEVRFSVRPCLPELELSALSFILHPPSVPLEYRGMIARHIESRYFITTTTRHSLTLPPGTSRSLCPRSLEPAEDKDRASSRTRKSSLSSFRGSHHDTMNSNEWPSFPWFSPRHYEHPSRHVRTR